MAVGSAWDLTPRQVDVVLPISQAASRQGTAVQTAHNEISPRIPLPTRTFPRRNIAIAPLEALGLSQSGALTLTESLRVTLGDSDYFNIVTRSDMEKILKEQDFQRSSSSDTQCLVEMGKILAVEKIIGGTVGRVGDTFSLSVRMIDVESGKIDHSVLKNISGKEDRLLDAMPVLGSELALKYAESRRE